MMRRLTSAPKPCGARARVHRPAGRRRRRRAGRSGRRRSGPGWRWPRPGRSGSRRRARAARAAACTSSTRGAELLGQRDGRRRRRSRTPGSMPSPVSSAGTPRRMPSRRSAVGQRDRLRGTASEVESHGSCPTMCAQQQRGVGDVAGQRAGLVERGGEGDHPVARDRAVGRLEPDDPAQRRGLADRAAGVGADRPRRECRRPPPRRCRPTSRPARALRSHGLSTGPKAEFSFDEPIANSSWLVLPSSGAPASCSCSTTVAV